MLKNIFKILAIFIIGAVGGIFADQIFWPYFVERPLFLQYKLEQSPVYVTERKEITNYIQENTVLKEAIEKVEKTVVGVKTKTAAGEILQGSGLVVTSDGLIVTLAEILPQGSDFYFYINEKWQSYQILKRDLENNLALAKLGEDRLSTTGFADLEKIKLGERVFLIAADFNTATSTFLTPPRKIVGEGIIASFDKDFIQTDIFAGTVSGSPLFNIEGKVVGLSTIDEAGKVSAIPITAIRRFLGF